MAGPIDLHIERLLARWSDARISPLGGAGTAISLPAFSLPAGWSKGETQVHFVAPAGYPFAQPDCFWTDEDLRLASGALPQNANFTTPMPGLSRALWFSWHVSHWNANRDDLLTWIASIRDRLSRAL